MGEKGPEWDLEDIGLKEELHTLSSEIDEVEEEELALEGGLQNLLDGWIVGKEEEEPSNRIASPMKNSDSVKNETLNKMDQTKELDKIITKEEDLDSDDDDDLPVFDMSNDTPVNEETKVIKGIKL